METPIVIPRRIHCTSENELDAFHMNTGPGIRWVSAFLGFEWFGKAEEGCTEFEQFLNRLGSVKFSVFQLKADADGLIPSTAGPQEFDPQGTVRGIEPDQRANDKEAKSLMAWLKERGKEKGESFWHSVEPSNKSDESSKEDDLYADRLGATHLLRAAHAWPAPLPQRWGLTRLLRTEGMPDPTKEAPIVILPFLETPAAKTKLEILKPSNYGEPVRIKYDALGGYGEVECIVNRFIPADTLNLGLVERNGGYLKANNEAEEIRRVLTRFEQTASTCMWSLPLLFDSEMVKALDPVVQDEYMEDPPGTKKLVSKMRKISRPVWRALAGLSSALDPILLSLKMPGLDKGEGAPEDAAEGNILTEFVSALYLALRNATSDTFKNLTPDEQRIVRAILEGLTPGQILDSLRDLLSRNNLLHVNADKRIYAERLARVLDLGTIPDKDEPGDSLLTGLLWVFLRNKSPDEISLTDQEKFLNKFGGNFNERLTSELHTLALSLEDESGAEKAILRIFKYSELIKDQFTEVPKAIADRLKPKLRNAQGTYREILYELIEIATAAGWQSFQQVLLGKFNGAEAVRRADGLVFRHALAAGAVDNPKTLAGNIRTSSFASKRLLRKSSTFGQKTDKVFDGFDDIAAKLWYPPFIPDIQGGKALEDLLNELFVKITEKLFPPESQPVRFQPDHVPAPLPIQIAASSNKEELQDFNSLFNGIGIAIRAKRKGKGRWASASLVDTKCAFSKLGEYSFALQPLVPTMVDGVQQIFVSYDGMPLAHNIFGDTKTQGQKDDSSDSDSLPFFTLVEANHADQPGEVDQRYEGPPPLIYGETYESFSYPVTNAGSLPKDQQKDERIPWKLKEKFADPGATSGCLNSMEYTRRTAVGKLTIAEISKSGQKHSGEQPLTLSETGLIGAALEGVRPLAHDYPRLALASNAANEGQIDILRSLDGAGMLGLGKVAEPGQNPGTYEALFQAVLSNIEYSNEAKILNVGLHCDINDEPDPALSIMEDSAQTESSATFVIKLQEIKNKRLVFKFRQYFKRENTEGGGDGSWIPVLEASVDGNPATVILTPAPESLWLRLKLNKGEGAMISFTHPEPETGLNSRVHRIKPAPLLLLRPKENQDRIWVEGTRDSLRATITLPRVGFHDFDRWFGNDKLKEDAGFQWGKEDRKKVLLGAENFFNELLKAYIARPLDEMLGQYLDNLPDLSVRKLLVELTSLDSLTGPDCETITRVLDLPVLNEVVGRIGQPAYDAVPKRYLDYLSKLHREYLKELNITCSESPNLKLTLKNENIEVQVPSGAVASLSIRPLVPKHYLEPAAGETPIFHPGMKQLALREYEHDGTKYFVFEGTSLTVEGMLAELIKSEGKTESEKEEIERFWCPLADKMVNVREAESARVYDLVASGNATGTELQGWRGISSIDIHTQRWRFSGRPIYNWFSPRESADRATAAVEIAHETSEFFEQDAFYDRSDDDAESVSKVLEPLPSQTVLQTIPWHEPSATMFRHRFTLHWRYEGALADKSKARFFSWPTLKPDPGSKPLPKWTRRVVMLADLSRLQLTRPQLRAFIPLTKAPATDRTEPAMPPPVAAILQERPFAFGGLADRIGAEIKTGFGYGFEKVTEKEEADAAKVGEKPEWGPVTPLDSRKEVGPDPRLSYEATDSKEALNLALDIEGPVGLTYDSPSAPAPAFPNTALSLCLRNLGKEPPTERNYEEHFVGASLRRYLDPGWLCRGKVSASAQKSDKGVEADFNACWWIEFRDKGTLQIRQSENETAEAKLLVDVQLQGSPESQDKKIWNVRFNRFFIDSFAEEDLLDVCGASAEKICGIALLHMPLEEGRAALSIFGLQQEGSQSDSKMPDEKSASGKTTSGHADISKGRINLPLMLASFEWSNLEVKVDSTGKEAPKVVPASFGMLRVTGAQQISATSASAPTFVTWTRTGRDFERFAAVDKSGHRESVRYDELDALLDYISVNKKATGEKLKIPVLTLNKKGERNPVWLRSEISGKPYPLHVHRHMAAVMTRKVEGLGQPFDVFHKALRMDLPLLQVSETDAALKNASLRIVEFETPAAILAGKGGTVPQDLFNLYGQSYFDFKAVGLDKKAGGISFFIRFVSPDTMRDLKKLTFKLTKAGKPEENVSPIRVPKLQAGDGPLAAVQITLRNDILKVKAVSNTGISREEPPVPTSTEALLVAVPGLYLEIEEAEFNNGQPELWCDVSMLAVPDGKPSADTDQDSVLPFEWFFSGGPMEGDDPSVQVSPGKLSEMAEVQARIIAISPPISIQPVLAK